MQILIAFLLRGPLENAVTNFLAPVPHVHCNPISLKSTYERKQKSTEKFLRWKGALEVHAPNLSNMRAFACIKRIKYFASNTPSDPMFAPVSVKRSSLSEPE
jgi:hypothetical protein